LTPLLVLIAATATGLVSYRLASVLSREFKGMGLTGIDIHKIDRPETAEMGGTAVIISLLFGSGILIALDGEKQATFVAALGVVGLAGVVGLVDDYFELRQRTKAVLIAAASAPLAYTLAGMTGISFPFIGTLPFGILVSAFVVPLAITTSANFSNMLAGFNGLEAGLATISIGTLSFLAAATGMWEGAVLGVLLLFACLGFLALNWYPAKIFPGDAGTLVFGAGLAAIGLISHLEFAAIVLSMPAALDFSLKMLSKTPFKQRQQFGDTTVREDGTLQPPGYPALAHAFMLAAPTGEKGLVRWILLMEALYACLAVFLTLSFVP